MDFDNAHWSKRVTHVSKNIGIVLALVTGLTSLVSLTIDFSSYVESQLERDKAAKIMQLTTYSNFGEILYEYRHIAKVTYSYLSAFRQNPITPEDLDALLDQYQTGAAIYYAHPGLEQYVEIMKFYEELGVLVRFGALDFDLIFEVVTFPSDFVAETQHITDFVKNNWFGKGQELSNFMLNMHILRDLYEQRRLATVL